MNRLLNFRLKPFIYLSNLCDMNGQLLPGHHLVAVAALGQGHDGVREEPNLLEPLNAPSVLQCELEENNLSNLMKCSIVLHH